VDAASQSAYDAFLNAARITGLVSTSLMVVAAIVVWFFLPPITPPQKGAHVPAGKPEAERDLDAPHSLVVGAHDRAEANLAAAELEESYAREAAEEYIEPATHGEPGRA
jgi:hypothetical protein